ARAYQVQIVRGPEYAERAKRAHIATEVATGRRGSIFDRNGNVLAKSVEAQSVVVRPALVTDPEAASRLLASALGMPVSSAKKLVTGKRPFAWAARKVAPRVAEAVRAAGLPGIALVREYERVYPQKQVAGQLLGFVDVDEKGIEGLELAFNDMLSGQEQRRVMQRDAAGRRLYSGEDAAFEDLAGEDLVLTIDTQVQYFAESALLQGVETFGARWAGCIVVDVPSGDVLAWAEYPFFNPNRAGAAKPFDRRNKTAMDALEQGSTIKPFLMAAALEEKIITPESEFDCEKGKWKLHNVTIRDTSAHAVLPAKDVIKYSSNIGMAKIGLALGAARYHKYLTRLGFGAKIGLPLAGENKGILRPTKQWSDVDLASASFGQSFSATIAQMAQAYLCLANDGLRKELRLVAPAAGAEKEEREPERVFSREVVWKVREMLRGAVEDAGGTARRARIEGLNVGGKTGTAQKASGDAYGTGRVASFAGMLPLEAPRYLVVVVLDEPVKNQYGGVVAAPIFKDVAMRTMAYHGLLPDSAISSALAEFAQLKETHAAGNALAGLTETALAGTAPAGGGQTGYGGMAVETGARPGLEARAELVDAAGGARTNRAPAVVGLSLRKAVEAFAREGLVPEIKGEGTVVVRQTPTAGSPLLNPPPPGSSAAIGTAGTGGPAGTVGTGGNGKNHGTLWLGEPS
ncbi:MAG: PASTA domain-containing protein, partial [Deltaproteobacteria bacterium]|nr:PASTA domain-containing protein [Deltaproteobacteria bacterium]